LGKLEAEALIGKALWCPFLIREKFGQFIERLLGLTIRQINGKISFGTVILVGDIKRFKGYL